ncbi:MAG: tetratricopeptide repeat protein [Candidatus Eiseniibacteriota bacterium]
MNRFRVHAAAVLACLLALSTTPPRVASAATDPAASPTWDQAGAAFQKGDWKAAADAYAAIAKREPGSGRAWYRLATCNAKLGKLDAAIPAYLKAEAIGQNPLVQFDLACAYARSGDKAKAMDWLDKAAAGGFRSTERMKNDPDIASLRGSEGFAALTLKVEANERPCSHDPAYRQFDFWVGEWQVKSREGAPAGTNSITIENGDCWVHEHWLSPGGNGESFNFYNPTTQKWHQSWVDDQGQVAEFDGGLKDGAMAMEGYRQGTAGARIPARLTLTPLPDGTVRQLGENSTDGGKTWTILYDLIYVRKAGG